MPRIEDSGSSKNMSRCSITAGAALFATIDTGMMFRNIKIVVV